MVEHESLAKIFKALANPHRLAIYERLRGSSACCRAGENPALCVCHIAEGTDLALSTVSHHLKELRKAGLIRCDKRGQWVHCSVNPETAVQAEAFFRSVLRVGKRGSAVAR